MSDSLRDALEKLAAERDSVSGHVGSDYHIRPYELRELLAAHPVEPAPVASRERVAEVLFAHDHEVAGSVWTWRETGPLKKRAYLARADALLAAGVFREGTN